MTARCGTYAGYNYHLTYRTPTCPPCKKAAADYKRKRRAHQYLSRRDTVKVDATGSRRRLQALMRIGWTQTELAARLGVSWQEIYRIRQQVLLLPATAQKVAALYDELSMLPGPSKLTAQRSARKGWPPPLAFDDDTIDDPTVGPAVRTPGAPVIDEIAVERAMRGYPTHLRDTERAEVVRRLTAQDMTAPEIARRLGIAPRSVTRIRTGKAA